MRRGELGGEAGVEDDDLGLGRRVVRLVGSALLGAPFAPVPPPDDPPFASPLADEPSSLTLPEMTSDIVEKPPWIPPGSLTRIFPGCKSAWRKLSSMSILSKVLTPIAASSRFSTGTISAAASAAAFAASAAA